MLCSSKKILTNYLLFKSNKSSLSSVVLNLRLPIVVPDCEFICTVSHRFLPTGINETWVYFKHILLSCSLKYCLKKQSLGLEAANISNMYFSQQFWYLILHIHNTQEKYFVQVKNIDQIPELVKIWKSEFFWTL